LPQGPLNVEINFPRKEEGQMDEELEMLIFGLKANCITPIRVIASSDYNETRNIFNMGTARSAKGLEKKFLLAIKNEGDDKDPNLRMGKVVPEQLKATVGEPTISKGQRLYPIILQVPAGTNPIELDGTYAKDFGKIVVETDMETAPEIPMYIKFRITE
jgi:hypothetical protein